MTSPAVAAAPAVRTRRIALVGNPNSGKTALFNSLTGLRQKIANYAGVTIEKKEGVLKTRSGDPAILIDLPGAYSLFPASPDEGITSDVVLGRYPLESPVDAVICVVDASNIERNLYLATQVIDHGIPTIIALNMVDVAEEAGTTIDEERLQKILGVPVIPTIAVDGTGVDELLAALDRTFTGTTAHFLAEVPEAARRECLSLQEALRTEAGLPAGIAYHESVLLLSAANGEAAQAANGGAANSANGRPAVAPYGPALQQKIAAGREKLEFLGIDRTSVFIEARYAFIRKLCATTVETDGGRGRSASDRIDAVLTHKVSGFAIFILLMTFMFNAIFSWAQYPMTFITEGFNDIGVFATGVLPPGAIRDLLVDGVIAGVGAVVTFLPQILALFFFISILEDTGYMARAAFIMDQVMSKVGLHGKAFIPLLSSFACAIPGIMSTRTIESRKDRIITMLIAPLMSCSARLPVYTLLIAAFIPAQSVFGILSLQGLIMSALYLLGIVVALVVALLLKRTILKGDVPLFVLELPPYRMPSLKSVGIGMYDRGLVFLKNAGTFILAVSVILWFLAAYPKADSATSAGQLEQSFAGRAGKFIEPVISPLGFNWKIGIGLIGSLLQREVFVSTMGTVYNISDGDGTGAVSLQEKIRSDRDPSTGLPSMTTLTAICLMIYYALSMQCMSTVAVVRRETGGWKWPLFMIAYMTALAYGATFAAYRIGLWMLNS